MPFSTSRLSIFLGVLLLSLPGPSALAQDPFLLERADADDHDNFGAAVDADGDLLVVGAPGATVDDLRNGAAYVYRRAGEGWDLEATLFADDLDEFDVSIGFGTRVAVSGDVIAVSAPFLYIDHGTPGGDDDTRGAVYVYRNTAGAWDFEAKLTSVPFDRQRRHYGVGLDLQGDRLVAGIVGFPISPGGTYYCTHPPTTPGRADVYRYEEAKGWEVEANLLPIDEQTGNDFGATVALDGDLVTVGAPLWYDVEICDGTDNDGDGLTDGTERGLAYLYRFDGTNWQGEALIQPEDVGDGDQFAFDVAVSGTTLLAGAPYTDALNTRFGAAYTFVYDGDSWVPEDAFVGENTNVGDRFGKSVDIMADYAVVGAPFHRNEDLNLGAMYAFQRVGGQWEQGLQITINADTGDFDLPGPLAFGAAVALSDDTYLIGAPDDPRGGTLGDRVGSAFAYATGDLFNSPVSVEGDTAPDALHLAAPYPNPASTSAAVAVEVPEAEDVRLALYDVLGRRVTVLHDGALTAGRHVLSVETGRLSAGVYLLRLETGRVVQMQRLTVVH